MNSVRVCNNRARCLTFVRIYVSTRQTEEEGGGDPCLAGPALGPLPQQRAGAARPRPASPERAGAGGGAAPLPLPLPLPPLPPRLSRELRRAGGAGRRAAGLS